MVKYIDINRPGYSVKCKVYCDAFRDAEHVIVFAHGFGGHKDNKAAERFAQTALSKIKKAAVFVFDWPCHGSDVRKKLLKSFNENHIEIPYQKIEIIEKK